MRQESQHTLRMSSAGLWDFDYPTVFAYAGQFPIHLSRLQILPRQGPFVLVSKRVCCDALTVGIYFLPLTRKCNSFDEYE
jgi:hypothetical protein